MIMFHAHAHLSSQQPAAGPDKLPGAVEGIRCHELQESGNVMRRCLQELREGDCGLIYSSEIQPCEC